VRRPGPGRGALAAAAVAPKAALANLAHAAALWPARRAFEQALADPARAQAEALARIARGGAGTAFAREHGLSPQAGVAALRRQVPPRSYDELHPWIERAAGGEPRVLTTAPVLRFQPSSGSAAPSKLIPWTAPYALEVRAAVSAWLSDQLRRWPALLGGQAYWSVSPASSPSPPTAGGIAVGFEDDAAYLGPVARRLATWGLAVPGAVRHLPGLDAWRRRTLLHLLRARQLRLLSVWSPTFLPLLLGPLAGLLEGLAEEIARGTPPCPVPSGHGTALLPPLPPDAARAAEVRRAGPDPLGLWPRLALVSCWTDGPSVQPSAAEAERLEALLPGVPVEGKGLVATEAVVSIPFGRGRPLAVTSHFLELETAQGPRLVHELREGEVGTVLVTTGAGLWRYRLQDRVEVTGFVGRTPTIRFLGKADQVCDRFGEKLHAGHAAALIAALRARFALPEGLAFLAPDEAEAPEGAGGPRRPCYTLHLAAPSVPAALADRLEGLLEENFHYAHCVRLGQLAPARVFRVEGDGLSAFYAACAARGQRLGDVKPSALRRDGGWSAVLPGGYVGDRAGA
jgi:hypothetical protein